MADHRLAQRGGGSGGGNGEYRGGNRLGRSGQRDAGRQDEVERLQCDGDGACATQSEFPREGASNHGGQGTLVRGAAGGKNVAGER